MNPPNSFFPIHAKKCMHCKGLILVMRNPNAWVAPGEKDTEGVCWKCQRLPVFAPIYDLIRLFLAEKQPRIYLANLRAGLVSG